MTAPFRIDVINGPNTNLYGLDPTGPYGTLTLDDIGERCRVKAEGLGASLRFRQSNHEGVLIDWLQQSRLEADGVVINAGSLSYTSIGILDALSALAKPSFQVHVSNVFKREGFRHYSPLSAVVTGCLIGLGPSGYETAVQVLVEHLRAV
ncbi:MAG TPA: type II 3-dehydroquinate dehydratase [Reyranella sp.]|nr:type II 3-dehydroquinate dehydratase [Reyranella sp.]